MIYLSLLIGAVLSWIAGLIVYLLLHYIMRGKAPEGGDLTALVVWSFVSLSVASTFIYLPSLMLLRQLLRDYRPRVAFALVPVVAAVLPTWLFFSYLGGLGMNMRAWLAPKVVMVYAMFGVAGAVFGIVFLLCELWRHRDKQRGFEAVGIGFKRDVQDIAAGEKIRGRRPGHG